MGRSKECAWSHPLLLFCTHAILTVGTILRGHLVSGLIPIQSGIETKIVPVQYTCLSSSLDTY